MVNKQECWEHSAYHFQNIFPTKLGELKEVSFDRLDASTTTTTIGSFKDLKASQLLTLTAMEKNLGSTKEVTKRATGEKISVRDC